MILSLPIVCQQFVTRAQTADVLIRYMRCQCRDLPFDAIPLLPARFPTLRPAEDPNFIQFIPVLIRDLMERSL